jgi:DNA-binding NtrC family response regulator
VWQSDSTFPQQMIRLAEVLRRQPGVGIIVITAFATFETAVEAMKLGAVDYLPKPFTPEQVRAAARRVVTANVLKRQLTELKERLDEAEGESRYETQSTAYAFGGWLFGVFSGEMRVVWDAGTEVCGNVEKSGADGLS